MDERRPQADPLDGAIDTARAAFIAALEAGDAKTASALYAEAATLLPPSADVLRGREAIESFWRAGIEAGIADIELEALEVERHDGLAYEFGRYALRLKPPDGGPVVDRGTYLLVHTRQPDGSWQRTVEMFNADAAAAEPARRPESVAIHPSSHRSS